MSRQSECYKHKHTHIRAHTIYWVVVGICHKLISYAVKRNVYVFVSSLHLAKGSRTGKCSSHVKFAYVVALIFLRSVSIFLTSYVYVLSVQSWEYFNL